MSDTTQRWTSLKTLFQLPKRASRPRQGDSDRGPPEDGFEKPPVVQACPGKIVEFGGKFARPGEFCKRLR